MECANYVRFTQQCRRGALRVGDKIDGAKIALADVRHVLCGALRCSRRAQPHTLATAPLTDRLGSSRPLVLIASSYT